MIAGKFIVLNDKNIFNVSIIFRLRPLGSDLKTLKELLPPPAPEIICEMLQSPPASSEILIGILEDT